MLESFIKVSVEFENIQKETLEGVLFNHDRFISCSGTLPPQKHFNRHSSNQMAYDYILCRPKQ